MLVAHSASNMETFTCAVHGELPISSFCLQDLPIRRHRCKQCLIQNTQLWRHKYPKRRLWSMFVQRARRAFDVRDVQLTWTGAGQEIVDLLMQEHAVTEADLNNYILTWPRGAATLNMQELVLVPR